MAMSASSQTQGKVPGSNLPRTPKLPSDKIKLRLQRGAMLIAADPDKRQELIDTYELRGGASSDYSNAAMMFWVSDRFSKNLVLLLPWSCILELSRPTKDLATREMLADLCMWWIESNDAGQTPSFFTIPPDKALLLAIIDHYDIYRDDLAILHAKARYHRNMPISAEEDALVNMETPDLISRVRRDKSVVVSKSVEVALAAVNEATVNGLRASQIHRVDETNNKVQEALTQIQEYLTSLNSEDNRIIITSLRNHANELERRLNNALETNHDLLNVNAQLTAELADKSRIESENKFLRDRLAAIKAGLDMVMTEAAQEIIVVDSSPVAETVSVE